MWKTVENKYWRLPMASVIIVAIGLFNYFNYETMHAKPPQAVNGVIDLSRWDLDGGETVNLNGQWEFYWWQFLGPSDFSDEKRPLQVDFFAVPDMWNNYKSGISPTGDGFATYRLNIRLPAPNQYVAIKVPDIATAYNLYINGQLLRSVGVIGQSPAESKPQYLPQIVNFYTDSPNIELIIQVSNFAHHKGGIKSILQFGREETVQKLQEKQIGFEMFLLGIFLIMSLYHFGFYMLRRQDKPALYFGLFCLLIAIRTMTTGGMVIMRMFPTLQWELLLKIEYLSYYLSVPVFVMFIYHLYDSDTPAKIPNAFITIGLLFSIPVVLTPVKFFGRTLLWYDFFTLLACLHVGTILVKAVIARKEGAENFVLGVAILVATVVNDILYANGLIFTGEMVPVGLFVFIFFQSLALSTRFSRSYTTLENLSAELQYSNDKIRHILESITEGFFALDSEGRFTYFNKEAERLWHKPQEQLLGKVVWDVFPVFEESRLYRYYHRMVSSQVPVHFETFCDRLGLWLEVNAYPAHGGVSVFLRNIQDRKQAEEKIMEYTEMLKEQVRLLDLDPDYTIERNLDGAIVFWNHGAELGYNWTKDEAVGKEAALLLRTQFPRPLQEINEELMRNGRWMGELTQTRRDGSQVIVRSCWLLKRDAYSNPIGVLEFNKDITEQKNMEKEIARLDRLNLIGQMAAGISHEVRNPMTTVRGFLQLLSQKEHNAKYHEYYELMLSELDRANNILTEYLSVAKPRSANFKFQDINDILLALSPLLNAEALKLDKEIIFDLQNVPKILLDDSEIRQLILNLCRNGLEAMSICGKKLMITTFCQGKEVVLSVRDEGPGISNKVINKLGTPFLSTKDNGTGLGLAVCYGIVVRHKAVIDVATGPQGTTFLVKFNTNA